MKQKSTGVFSDAIHGIGVACCLAWMFITNNKLINSLKQKEEKKSDKANPLGLKELELHDLGHKYLKSFRG